MILSAEGASRASLNSKPLYTTTWSTQPEVLRLAKSAADILAKVACGRQVLESPQCLDNSPCLRATVIDPETGLRSKRRTCGDYSAALEHGLRRKEMLTGRSSRWRIRRLWSNRR
jgi:hypothetical protein